MVVLRLLKYLSVTWICLSLPVLTVFVHGQSLDARSPSPISSNEVVGRIAARDIGDARLTDHFYAFAGTPGDLLITIETRNLNGDIDVFTAGALRPVLKVAVYAESTTPVTKSIYLRQHEDLILRVEARSPNDDDGIYRFRFSGSFQALAEGTGNVEDAASLPANRKGKRVSSVGARIDEPVPPQVDVATASTPEPSSSVSTDPPPAELKSVTPAEPAPTVSATPRTRSTPSARRGTRSKPATTDSTARKSDADQAATDAEVKTTADATKTESTEEPSEEAPAASSKKPVKKGRTTRPAAAAESVPATTNSGSARAKNSKRTSTVTATEPESARTSTVTAAEPEPASEPDNQSPAKIIIEMLDGTRFEQLMSNVRRVTVESGQIVVTGTDGKIQRIRLATVVRMSIGP